MSPPRSERCVLVLGGTGEARELAEALTRHAGWSVVSSLAVRVADPALPAGEVRIGGFGGVDGLEAWLLDNAVDAIIDATHPFAAAITGNAAAAASWTQTPLLRLQRPGWHEQSGDQWHHVVDMAGAATAARGLGERVFLTIGRQEVAAFAEEPGWFLVRAIERPEVLPARHELLLSRGPFDVDGEIALMRDRAIDLVVTKESGGDATVAKLVAARTLSLPVVMVSRPALPDGVPVVGEVAGAIAWLESL